MAVFFDMDNTLIKTDKANFLAYQKAVGESIGHKYASKMCDSVRFDKTELRNLFPFLSKPELIEIVKLKGIYYPLFLDETTLNERIFYALESAAQSNSAVLVTNANRQRALETIKHHGLLHYFKRLVFGAEKGLDKNKYDLAFRLTGFHPSSVRIFEDDHQEMSNALDLGVNRFNIIQVR